MLGSLGFFLAYAYRPSFMLVVQKAVFASSFGLPILIDFSRVDGIREFYDVVLWSEMRSRKMR